MNESTSFKMGPGDDAPIVNAWGRPADENIEFDDQHSDNYDTMTVPALKDEITKRREAGREIDTTGVTKKSQVITLLREDDAAQAEEAKAEDESDEDETEDED